METNVKEIVKYSHTEYKGDCIIVYFKNCNENIIFNDEMRVQFIKENKEEFEKQMKEKNKQDSLWIWVKVEIKLDSNKTVNAICLCRNSTKFKTEPIFMKGLDPYTAVYGLAQSY